MRTARENKATEVDPSTEGGSGERPRGVPTHWSPVPRESGVVARRDAIRSTFPAHDVHTLSFR